MNWELTLIYSPCFLMGCADSSGEKKLYGKTTGAGIITG